MPTLAVTEFTDPACPWALSAEPVRWRLWWLYGDEISWTTRLVGLAKNREQQAAKGFDGATFARVVASTFTDLGMPLATGVPAVVPGSWDADRHAVGVRQHRPEAARRFVRALQVGWLSHHRLLDDPTAIDTAAREAGLDPAEVRGWAALDATEDAFRSDLDAARRPSEAALHLRHKLARSEDDWEGGPGWRYTCPSLELTADGRTYAVPGFQPTLAAETAIANLAPALRRREWATDPLEPLRWADEPLATAEVAALLGRDHLVAAERDTTREELRAAGAHEHAAGTDAYWTAP